MVVVVAVLVVVQVVVVGSISVSIALIPILCWAQLDPSKKYSVNTIAFYNVENLFDTLDDPKTFDDDRTPNGRDKWTEELVGWSLETLPFILVRTAVVIFAMLRHPCILISFEQQINSQISRHANLRKHLGYNPLTDFPWTLWKWGDDFPIPPLLPNLKEYLIIILNSAFFDCSQNRKT